MEFADPIFVAQLGYPLTIPGLLEFVDVPGKICRRDLHLPSCEVDMGKTLELRVLVRRDVNGLTVLAESRAAVGGLSLRFSGRQLGFFSGPRVHQPEIRLVDGNPFHEKDLLVIG